MGTHEEEIRCFIEQAADCEAKRDYQGAIDYFTRVVEVDPANALAYHRRGWARAQLGDLAGEIADWSKAIEINPKLDQAYADRAIARTAMRDYQNALSDGQKALALNPSLKETLDPIVKKLEALLNESGAIFDQMGGIGGRAVSPSDSSEPSGLAGGERIEINRRKFLHNIGGMAVATMALTLSGCGFKGVTEGKGKIRWGMIIDLKRCIGCKACTIACKAENHTPPGVAYNVVMEEERGEFPFIDRVFISRPCMQCANSSCTLVCPTGATYHRDDGIVAVDYDKCIGCRYCIAACPYGARSFDYGENYWPDLSPHERQPSPEYGQYRRRQEGESPIGNVRKCTFCLHRITKGLPPACAATCIGYAIHFGNLRDPEAKCMVHGEKLQELLATRSHMRLKEELGNEPAVYYLT